MRLAYQIAIIFVGFIAINGCKAKGPANSADAKARIEAALQINNPSERDDALAQACRGAAKIGAGEVVVNAVSKIGNPSVRDEVEMDCVLYLRNAGQASAALEVAKLIGNPSTRDDTLKKLSSGL